MLNSLEALWDLLAFPETSLLDKRVPKKHFIDNGDFISSDKKLFQESVCSIYWRYTLKSSTCGVLPFKDDEREYLEIAVLQIELASLNACKRVAELIHRTIPYPLLLVFYTENSCALSLAPKRFRQGSQSGVVLGRLFLTQWLELGSVSDNDCTFVKSISWNTLPRQNYGELYQAWINAFINYESSLLSQSLPAKDNALSPAERLCIVEQCQALEREIVNVRVSYKKADFREQVELHIQMKQKELERKQLIEKL